MDDSYLIIFLLLNRILGEEVTGCANVQLTDNWVRGKVGGWMKEVAGIKNIQGKTHAIDAPSVSGFSTAILQREYGLSLDAIQLLSLFSAHPNADHSLLKVMSGLHRLNEINLSIFPKKIQWKYLSRPEYQSVQTANHLLYDDWYTGYFNSDQVPLIHISLLIS
jgi:hypothetical protein